MGMHIDADIIAGLPESKLVSVMESTEKVKRYNEKTGKAYTKEQKVKKITVGSTEIGDKDDIFDFLEDKLDFSGGYWDNEDGKDDCNAGRIWGKSLRTDGDGGFDIQMLEDLLKEAQDAFSKLGIKAKPNLYLVAEMVD